MFQEKKRDINYLERRRIELSIEIDKIYREMKEEYKILMKKYKTTKKIEKSKFFEKAIRFREITKELSEINNEMKK